MKNIFKLPGVGSFMILLCISCVDYLDKAPEVNISDDDVFSKFNSYQGFVEGIYQNIVDITIAKDATAGWNFGDDVRNSNGDGICYYWEKGATTAWLHKSSPYTGYVGGDYKIDNTNKRKGYWHNGWYGIRSCNLGLDNLDRLVGTQEERDILEGQCRFLRAYFHFEILRAWGGIPYIDTVYASTDILREPRLSYLETANRITEDLKKAAQLLPASWDETAVGQATLGSNAGRVTKGAAYGYLGMNLLYAASPLANGVETGNYDSYNPELCKQAAEAFYEVIKLANQGYHGLENWEKYADIFYSLRGTFMPIANKEVIFSNPIYTQKRYNLGESIHPNVGGPSNFASVTANYVENFGMANGLPIDAAGSGFDPANPWVNRDPRFYYNITKDGDRLIMNTNNADTYAQFYVGGRHTNVKSLIVSFAYQKFHHVTCNKYDNGWSNYWYKECPHLRLAEVYLNYAEAVNEAYGPTGSVPGGITAAAALNIVRTRAGVPDVDARYLGDKADFREIVRQERAVELAFEGHRWNDLRRWHIAHLLKYREKYHLEFDKQHTYFKKVLDITTVHDEKHYWLPFEVAQVNMYPEFEQNPGW